MTRYFFFTLLFPPAFMDLMLAALSPSDVPRYFIAGYIIAVVPAVLIALLDEPLQRYSHATRTGIGALVAFSSAPIAFWYLSDGNVWLCAQAGCFAAIAAFICITAFARMSAPKPKLLRLPSPEHFKAVAGPA